VAASVAGIGVRSASKQRNGSGDATAKPTQDPRSTTCPHGRHRQQGPKSQGGDRGLHISATELADSPPTAAAVDRSRLQRSPTKKSRPGGSHLGGSGSWVQVSMSVSPTESGAAAAQAEASAVSATASAVTETERTAAQPPGKSSENFSWGKVGNFTFGQTERPNPSKLMSPLVLSRTKPFARINGC
ncbi:unnamed protein product, partial [Laminaria digitata]